MKKLQYAIETIKLLAGVYLSYIAISGFWRMNDIFRRGLYYNSKWEETAIMILPFDKPASMAPIFFGLCAIAGAYLLSKVNFDRK